MDASHDRPRREPGTPGRREEQGMPGEPGPPEEPGVLEEPDVFEDADVFEETQVTGEAAVADEPGPLGEAGLLGEAGVLGEPGFAEAYAGDPAAYVAEPGAPPPYDEAAAAGFAAEAAEEDEADDDAGPPVAEPAQRLVARLVDILVVGVPVGAAATEFFPHETAQRVVAPIGFAVVFLIYETLQLALWGRTLGKRFTGIRVVSIDGRSPRLSQALVRAAVYALPPALRPVPVFNVLAAIFWLANVGFLFDRPYRQALHDRAAGTLVVRGDALVVRGDT